MKKLITGTLGLLLIIDGANAMIPIRQADIEVKDQFIRKASVDKASYDKRIQKLVGTWILNSSNKTYQVTINSVTPSAKKLIALVNYDVTMNNYPSDQSLVGYLVGNMLFLTISFLDSYSALSLTFNKNFTGGAFVEENVLDRNCYLTSANPSSGDIYSCTFPVSQVGYLDTGTIR